MGSKSDVQGNIEPMAREILEVLSSICETAERLLRDSKVSRTRTQSANNSWTSSNIDDEIAHVAKANAQCYYDRSHEPAIARVEAIDDDDQKNIYYICRTDAVSIADKRFKIASYRAPIGQLASLPVGTERTLMIGGRERTFEILEQAEFLPFRPQQEWDAHASNIQGENFGPMTVESLRSILSSIAPEVDPNLLERLLKEEHTDDSIHNGLRRTIIMKMDLRDQPILDQQQDRIFRLPLNSRLLILGAPGTGKTTTLIRRLGQKLDVQFLSDEEKRAINIGKHTTQTDHRDDWIMFTPTELLKLYVKEAFNREHIPAPDTRISTWADFRDDLARNKFSILRSSNNQGSFILRDNAATLSVLAQSDAIAWFNEFDYWQKDNYWNERKAAAQRLSENSASDIVARMGKQLLRNLDTAEQDAPRAFNSLSILTGPIANLLKAKKDEADKEINGILNLQVNRNTGFLDNFADFMQTLKNVPDDEDAQDGDDEDDDDDISPAPRTDSARAAAANAYRQVVRQLARKSLLKRGTSKTPRDEQNSGKAGAGVASTYEKAVLTLARSRNVLKRDTSKTRTERILEWLGAKVPPHQILLRLGENLALQSDLRRFSTSIAGYIDRVPQRYAQFRRAFRATRPWYAQGGFNASDVHPLEVDIMLLAMMRNGDELVRRSPQLVEITPVLKRQVGLYRTQVLADEATDFSPVQLCCMSILARPGTRSFFACGDFNQRVTSWGTRSREEIRWAVPDMETRIIAIAYRQSRQLHNVARALVHLSGGNAADVALPDHTDNDGVAPALAVNMSDKAEVAAWLTQRIVEIERSVGVLPSIAVIVDCEAEVQPVASALSKNLAEHSVRVTACPDGQVRGSDNSVRVFNVQHIKGLEFEAVFFVGVDKIAEDQPDLFDKYFYVGLTRAATYLGITCEKSLPRRMEPLRKFFGEAWG